VKKTKDTKACTRCKIEKPLSEFRIKIKATETRISLCHPCDIAYRAERWAALGKESRDKCREYVKRREEDLLRRIQNGEVEEPLTKICRDCKQEKPIEQFRWRNQSYRYRLCRCEECDREDRARRYSKNPAYYYLSNQRLKEKRRILIDSYKQVPCADCGKIFPPCAMDFDHRDPATKISKISSYIYGGSEEELLSEIAKCDVVCAVCHRIRTHKQQHEFARSMGLESRRAG